MSDADAGPVLVPVAPDAGPDALTGRERTRRVAEPGPGGAPTRSEAIARSLRRDILRGRWQPGDRLPAEREIATRMGVHRSSVREALRKLEDLRLVVIQRGGGARVRPLEGASIEVVRDLLTREGRLDPVLAQQVLDVREMLVAGAARLAAERGSREAIARAQELVRALAAPKTSDAELARVLDELAELVMEASGNLVLRLLRNGVQSLFGARGGRPPRPRLSRPDVARAVRGLESALAGGAPDPAAVEEAVRRLLRATQPRALDLLESLARDDAPESASPERPSSVRRHR